MPIHDWTGVSAGTFHDFHVGWIPLLRTAFNDGILPAEYDAQAEQVTGPLRPGRSRARADQPDRE